MSLIERVVHTREILTEGIQAIANPSVHGHFSLQYFEGVAKLRYALIVVAELLHAQVERKRQQIIFSREGNLLLEMAKECCIDASLNSDDAGPGVFLVKQIFKQFGKAFLQTLTSDQSMEWIIPERLRRSDEVHIINEAT